MHEVRRWYDHLPTAKNQTKTQVVEVEAESLEEYLARGGNITKCPPCTASEYWKEKCAWQFKAVHVPENL